MALSERRHVFVEANELIFVGALVEVVPWGEFDAERFNYYDCERTKTGERFRLGVDDRLKLDALKTVHPLMMLALQAEDSPLDEPDRNLPEAG